MSSDEGETVLDDLLMQTGFKDAARLKTKVGDALFGSGMEMKIQKAQSRITGKNIDDIEEMNELEDDEEIRVLMQRRIDELKRDCMSNLLIVEDVQEISELDFEECIQDSQKSSVLLLIYSKGQRESQILLDCLCAVQKSFSSFLKSFKMPFSGHLKNLSLEDMPVLMVYTRGMPVSQFSGLSVFAGLKTTPQVVEWELSKRGIIKSSIESDPREFRLQRACKKYASDDFDDEW